MEYYVKICKYHSYSTLYYGTHGAYLSLDCANNGFRTIKKARKFANRFKKNLDDNDTIEIVTKVE